MKVRKDMPSAKVGGERYHATVLLVTERDTDGRPRRFLAVYDDEKVNISGGEEFVIGYLHAKSIEPKVKSTGN